MDPRVRLALLLCAGLLAVSLERPLALGVFALLCAAPLALVEVPPGWRRRGLLATALLVWSTALSQSLFYAEQPRVALFSLGPLSFWREGLSYGLAQSLRLVGLSLAGLAVALSTPPDRMVAALLALRVPFGLALMAATALRFLPEVGREWWLVRRARAARGRPAHRRSPWAWLQLEVSLLRPVIARSWRRAHALAESLDTRGFDPLAPRAVRRPLRMRGQDWAVLVGATGVTALVVGVRLLFLLYTAELFYRPELRGLYGLVRAWL